MTPSDRGGSRPGAGRPKGEPSTTIRIPASQTLAVVALLESYRERRKTPSNVAGILESAPEPAPVRLPLIESPAAQAGFPSPAADYVEEVLDLNKLMIRNPPATFFTVVSGDSMVDARIFDKDIVAVDRSIKPKMRSIVVAVADGDIYIKSLEKIEGRLALVSKHEARAAEYPPIFLDKVQEYQIWGVVTGSVRKF